MHVIEPSLVCRSDIPPIFGEFKGRGPKVGKALYGDMYVKGMPVPLQAENFKWTAAISFTFLLHAVTFLSPLIKDHDEPMWKNFKLHQRYLIGLMQWSASVGEIVQLDVLIREHQHGLLAIWQWNPFYRFKNHAACHGPRNFLYTCPLRAGWCLKGDLLGACFGINSCFVCVEEMKLREPKNDAQNSNHINPLLSMAEGSSKRDAWRRTSRKTHFTEARRLIGLVAWVEQAWMLMLLLVLCRRGGVASRPSIAVSIARNSHFPPHKLCSPMACRSLPPRVWVLGGERHVVDTSDFGACRWQSLANLDL